MVRDSGFAMILVIWALVALSSLAAGFVLGTRHEIHLARDAVPEVERNAAIIGALNYAFLSLNLKDPQRRWLADGQLHEIPWHDGISLRARVRSEGGKIDINRAPRELIEGLIEGLLPDMPVKAMTDALIDWRDSDERPLPEGAEADRYAKAGYRYTPPNRPFQSVHELTQVMGFDSDSVDRLLPYITVLSRQSRIEPLSAGLAVLLAIPGVEEGDARSFAEMRNAGSMNLNRLPYQVLKAGSRFISTGMHNKTIGVDIEVRLGDTDAVVEQVIAQMGPDRYYHIVARGVPEDRARLAF